MIKRIAALATVLVLGAFVFAASIAGASAPSEFDWHLSDAFIQSHVGLTQTGSVAEASNGDFVRLSGRGEFNASTSDAAGGGAFVHTDADGNVLGFGRWRATGVEDFEFFGCDGEGFPSNFCGGELTLDVRLIGTSLSDGAVKFDGVLTIICTIGPDVPAGTEEGSTLSIPGINFDQIIEEESGINLFVIEGD